jgi:hypothetical protein
MHCVSMFMWLACRVHIIHILLLESMHVLPLTDQEHWHVICKHQRSVRTRLAGHSMALACSWLGRKSHQKTGSLLNMLECLMTC